MGCAFALATVGLIVIWNLSGCGSSESNRDEVRHVARAYSTLGMLSPADFEEVMTLTKNNN